MEGSSKDQRKKTTQTYGDMKMSENMKETWTISHKEGTTNSKNHVSYEDTFLKVKEIWTISHKD